jgi:hypothetical protein
MLSQYADFTSLKVNYHKSSMIPINIPHDEDICLAQGFDYRLGSMPFTYLGLPIGTTNQTIRDLYIFIDRVERRLSATTSFLSYGDRLVLVNYVISSLPIFSCSP